MLVTPVAQRAGLASLQTIEVELPLWSMYNYTKSCTEKVNFIYRPIVCNML